MSTGSVKIILNLCQVMKRKCRSINELNPNIIACIQSSLISVLFILHSLISLAVEYINTDDLDVLIFFNLPRDTAVTKVLNSDIIYSTFSE